MLNVERILQVNVAMLVVLGALLLGLGHGNASLPIMATLAAAISLYVTDFKQWFYFNRIVANIAAILAAAYSLNDFFRSNSESQLFAIASLLIYLQIVLLFQRKTSRLYWQLLVLSLLQVVVAAALYVRFESGVLFFLYMLLALSAMTLTYIHRETSAIRLLATRARDELKTREAGEAPNSRSVLLRGAPISMYEHEIKDVALVNRMLRSAMIAGAGAMVFAAIFFYSIPRMHETWRGPDFSTSSVSGFAKVINFDNKGQVALSERVMFRATFIDPDTDQPMQLNSDPYFRGMVLNYYRKSQGVDGWDYRRPREDGQQQRAEGPIPQHSATARLHRMRVAMDPNNESILFSAYPYYQLPGTPNELKFVDDSYTLIRDPEGKSIEFTDYAYELAIDSIKNDRQTDIFPYWNPQQRNFDARMGDRSRAYLTSHVRDRQPRLRELVFRLIEGIPRTDHKAIAERLCNHLRLSGDYQYTLDFREVDMNRDLDSIEDFVANHKQGHCEYFASTLCMMLRHVGIPARIVIGFRCDNYNELVGHYVVQEQHAHAWVEAYLSPDHVTPEMKAQGLASDGGAWYRLDPTPLTPSPTDEDILTRAGDALDLAQMLWDDFVFGFNANRQKSNYYEGIFGGSGLMDTLATTAAWNNLVETTSDSLGVEKDQGRMIVQAVVVLVLIITVACFGLLKLRRRSKQGSRPTARLREIFGSVAALISPKLGRWIAGPDGDPLIGPKVDFYEELGSILKAHGYERNATQSQNEFIETILARFQGDPGYDQLATVLPSIVEAFYLVRFGQRAIPTEKLNMIQGWLGTLDAELKQVQLSAGTSTS